MNAFRWLLVAGLLVAPCAHALILVGTGNKPVSDRHWPTGAVEVANLPTRIGWWEGPPFGGGQWHFEYAGDTAAFQQAIDTFAKIQAPALDLFVHDEGKNSFALKTNRLDWTFVIWDPRNWSNLYGGGKVLFSDDPNAGKPMPPPRLDLYLGGSDIDFSRIVVPKNITVHDERASAAGVDISGGSVFVATISNALTRAPLPGARLIVRERSDRFSTNVVTDINGVARVNGIPLGGYQLSAAADGFVEVPAGWFDLSAHSYKKVSAALAPARTLAGKLVDESGRGVPGVSLIAANTLLPSGAPYSPLNKPGATTDSAGRFVLDGLPPGRVQIWLRATNYFAPHTFDYHAVPGEEVSILVKATGSLRVQVRDAVGNGAAANISVEPREGRGHGKWSASANLTTEGSLFHAVHPGTYVVTVHNTHLTETVTVLPNETSEVTIDLPAEKKAPAQK